MHIGLNATCFDNRSSGATQRFKGIYEPFFELRQSDDFTVFQSKNCDMSKWFSRHPNVRFISTPLSSNDRWRRLINGYKYWNYSVGNENFDLFEGYHLPFTGPRGARSRILTVHDIRGMTFEKEFIYSEIFKRSIKACDRIITVSHAMKNEILNYFPKSNIDVLYNGIDYEKFQGVDLNDARLRVANLGLPSQFILSVGHFEPRKNYARLIEAMSKLKAGNHDLFLVIAGNDGGKFSSLKNLKKMRHEFQLNDRIAILENISDDDIAALYKVASLLVFPSLYEGFGIPILECMASECPYVLSNIPVFREITQSKAIYFDPKNSDSIAETISSTIESTEMLNKIRKFGVSRVQDFSFKRIAHDLNSSYCSII